jgi:hypothetical protein
MIQKNKWFDTKVRNKGRLIKFNNIRLVGNYSAIIVIGFQIFIEQKYGQNDKKTAFMEKIEICFKLKILIFKY